MNKPYKPSRSIRNFRMKATLASFAVLALSAQGLRADNLQYTGGATATYDTAGDYYDATTMATATAAPGINDDVLFNMSGTNQGETITLVSGDAANSWTFSNTGTTALTGASGSFTLGGSSTDMTAPGITVNSGAGAFSLSESAIIGASQTWTNSSSNAVTLNSAITGAASMGTAGSPEILTFSSGGFSLNYVAISNGSGGVLALDVANGASVSYGKAQSSTYSGGTNILSGSMTVGAVGGFGTGTITLGSTTAATAGSAKFAAGGTATNAFVAQGSGASTIVESTSGDTLGLSGGITLNNSTALELEASGSSNSSGISISGTISGSGTGGLLIAKVAGTNFTATLSGPNTYSGGTTVSSGTLDINNATAVGTGTLTVGTASFDNTSGAAITMTNNNAVVLSGNPTFNGTNALNLGTGGVSLTASRTITTSASTLTIGGPISGTTMTFGLTKAGAGALVLNGVNTYTGTTSVTAGTLGGSGTIAGLLAMSGTSTLSPGPSATVGSVGTLTVGSLTLVSTTSLLFDLGTNSDLITDNGALTLAGTVTATGGTGFGPGTYDLINYGGLLTNNGLTVSSSSTAGYTYTIDTSSTPGEVLLDVAVPEPSTVAMSLLALGALGFVLRRKAGSAIA